MSSSDIEKKHDELIAKMEQTKKEWSQEAAATDDGKEEDDTDRLLQQAIDLAIQQGKGWTSVAEKEAYLKQILDDDYIPPLFASTPEELEKSGLAEAFSSLLYEGSSSPTQLYLEFKKKGNDAFSNGQRNEAKNQQYFRDAINHYYEALMWAQKIVPKDDTPEGAAAAAAGSHPDDPLMTDQELNEIKSTLCANAALAHMQLRNWGHARDDSNKALTYNKKNIKAWYRLAKGLQMLQLWEDAGDAIDGGLAVDASNKELKQLRTALATRVQKARKARQQRERLRAQRVARVKQVWKHCQEQNYRLGRVALVATVTDDEDDNHGSGDKEESKWHFHHPHTGELPTLQDTNGEWSWPCLFVYPSHSQSDFIQHFGESEQLASRMAQLFPLLDDEDEDDTVVPWDTENDFVCSKLAVYFEVHGCHEQQQVAAKTTGDIPVPAVHPEEVELLRDQGSTMRFYESSRALKGDEGPDMANVARAVERKHLYQLRKAWTKQHGSLWAKPDPSPIIRVHPSARLQDVLKDPRMVVPNFLVTFILFPENHAAHEAYLMEHKCIGIIQPKELVG